MKIKKGEKMIKARPRTYVAIILDQSGSMGGTVEQTVQSYNEQIQQMKLNSKEQDIFCSLITFNGDVFQHIWCEPATNLTEANKNDYKPQGSTAMRDALGYAVSKLSEVPNAEDENVAFLVITISDGYENASKHFTTSQLRKLIEEKQKTNRWTFTYLGCSEDYLKEIEKETSIPISNMAAWSNKTPELAARGMNMNNGKMDSYYYAREKGDVKVQCLLSDNVSACANFAESNDSNVVNSNQATPGFADDESGWVPIRPNIPIKIQYPGHDAQNKAFCNSKPVQWKV